jgi:hypothetical protein
VVVVALAEVRRQAPATGLVVLVIGADQVVAIKVVPEPDEVLKVRAISAAHVEDRELSAGGDVVDPPDDIQRRRRRPRSIGDRDWM